MFVAFLTAWVMLMTPLCVLLYWVVTPRPSDHK